MPRISPEVWYVGVLDQFDYLHFLFLFEHRRWRQRTVAVVEMQILPYIRR